VKCTACEFNNPPRARFCLNCGVQLGVSAPAEDDMPDIEELDSDIAPSSGMIQDNIESDPDLLDEPESETALPKSPSASSAAIIARSEPPDGTDDFELDKLIQHTPAWKVYTSQGKELGSEGITVIVTAGGPLHAFERAELLKTAKEVVEFRHPGAVPTMEVFERGGAVYITTAKPRGESLARILKQKNTLPWKEAVGIALKVLDVLRAAHSRRILHEDLRPENVCIDAQGNVTLNLFGLSARYRDFQARHLNFNLRYFTYLSPEQVSGKPLGPHSDLYALGILIYEMLTGRPPFISGDIAHQHLEMAASDINQLVEGLPKELADIVMRLLMKVPELRYARADEVIPEMQALLEGVPSPKAEGRELPPRTPVQGFDGAEAPSLFMTEEDEQTIAPAPSAAKTESAEEVEWDSGIQPAAGAERKMELESDEDVPAQEDIPPEADAAFEKALELHQAGQLNEAVSCYTEALAKAPRFSAAYNNRGMAHYDSERYDEAIADFNAALEIDKDYSEAFLGRGLAQFKKNKYDQAIKDYTKSISLNPDDPTAYYNRGIAYYELKDFRKAYEDYSKVVDADPTSGTAYYNRGIAAYKMRDWDQALRDFDKVIELNPKQANAFFNRGNILGKRGQVKRALEDLTQAVKLKGDYAIAYFTRGTIFNKIGEHDKAIADFTESIRLSPDHAASYYSRGCAYGNLDKFMDAARDFDEAIRLEPNYGAAYYNRAIAYEMLGYKRKATPDFAMAEKLGYKPK